MSTDGKEWTTVKKMRNQDGGEDTASLNGTKARYVKITRRRKRNRLRLFSLGNGSLRRKSFTG